MFAREEEGAEGATRRALLKSAYAARTRLPSARSGQTRCAGRRFRVLAVVPFEKEDESPFVGLLPAEAV